MAGIPPPGMLWLLLSIVTFTVNTEMKPRKKYTSEARVRSHREERCPTLSCQFCVVASTPLGGDSESYVSHSVDKIDRIRPPAGTVQRGPKATQ